MMLVLLSCYRRVSYWSNIAEFAALQATREDIVKMRQALQLEERELASSAPGSSESGDMQFHLAIAEATHNSMLVELFRQSWQWRKTIRCGSVAQPSG